MAPGGGEVHIDTTGAVTEAIVVVDATRGSAPAAAVAPDGPVLVVVADAAAAVREPALLASADVVVCERGENLPGAVEVDDPRDEAQRISAHVRASPVPALSLSWLLRISAHLTVAEALIAESAVYSTLLSGAAFMRWLAARGPARDPGPPERIRVERIGNRLAVTLARPGRRNAYDAAMRDALRDALLIARWDPQVQLDLAGDGPSFCAGGDLDEFGTATDPAEAHIIRLATSTGRLLAELRNRVTVRVHGDCAGSGVELAAFAGRVIAAPGATFRLPELEMGLIPGAGGTVSLRRRIGRGRTAWLALSGAAIDTETALSWGLVDAVDETRAAAGTA
jgi:enoyl-CoA hydratase/carnithine racemase